MSKTIAVDCMFNQDGRVRVRRIQLDDQWFSVEQGRQWMDENGRHILVSIPGTDVGTSVQEILLSTLTLQWHLQPRRTGLQIV